MQVRLATYPNETPEGWLGKAQVRREELAGAGAVVKADLQRWLPSTWPINDQSVSQMLAVSLQALDQVVAVMQEIARPAGTRAPEGPEESEPPAAAPSP